MDYSAGAPELSVSVRARKNADKYFANPSSIHEEGLRAHKILEESRNKCAEVLLAHSDEIIFTTSGTESDNLAILGLFKWAKINEARDKVHLITTTIEHPAVLNACKHLEKMGAEVTYLNPGEGGIISIKEFKASLRPETILVSIGYANSEIGVVQPIKEIAKEIRHYKKSSASNQTLDSYPYFHTDACQAGAYLPLAVDRLGVDLLTINGTKIGGARGTGLLYKRRGVKISEITYGGAQEFGFRAGTENVSSLAGFSLALSYAKLNSEKESIRLTHLRNYFFEKLEGKFPNCRINGDKIMRLPNNISVSFRGFTSELLVVELDTQGIAVSAGSACSSAEESGSHVLSALYGEGDDKKWGTVRFSLGKDTRKSDIDFAIKSLEKIFKKYEGFK